MCSPSSPSVGLESIMCLFVSVLQLKPWASPCVGWESSVCLLVSVLVSYYLLLTMAVVFLFDCYVRLWNALPLWVREFGSFSLVGCNQFWLQTLTNTVIVIYMSSFKLLTACFMFHFCSISLFLSPLPPPPPHFPLNLHFMILSSFIQ